MGGGCRTVDMGKGTGPGFLPYGQRPVLMTHVSEVLRDSQWLRSATLPREKEALPALDNAVNTAHAFVKAAGGRNGDSSTTWRRVRGARWTCRCRSAR